MATLKIGDPLDAATTMGPLVSATQKARVEEYLAAGDRDGAQRWTLETPGLSLPGHFVAPTIFTGGDSAMSIAQEEIFGPVLCVQPFDGFHDAVALANSTRYGLAAGIWTRDISKAMQFARHVAAGNIEVNTFLAGVPELPIVGHRDSGLGSERGRNAVQEFTDLKTFKLQLDAV